MGERRADDNIKTQKERRRGRSGTRVCFLGNDGRRPLIGNIDFLEVDTHSSHHYITKQFISKAPYLRGIPQVGLIEEVAYLLRSALQGLQVVAHLLMEIVGAFEG